MDRHLKESAWQGRSDTLLQDMFDLPSLRRF